MRHRKRTVSPHEERMRRDAQQLFREWRGPAAYRRREREIRRLTVVIWNGQPLRAIRCQAEFGRGPHDWNVPESVLWSLSAIDRFLCPGHL